MLSFQQSAAPVIYALADRREIFYSNPLRRSMEEAAPMLPVGLADMQEADDRLRRFGPLMVRLFPETAPLSGILESPLEEVPQMARWLRSRGGSFSGRLLLKRDDALPVAGSVKARGGIYEVLKHTEELAQRAGLLRPQDSYSVLADRRDFFSQYTMVVSSTGNLGLSIGLMSAALGYRAVVHMSADAKTWKKELLRAGGVTVEEHAGSYSEAVAAGRQLAARDPQSYFVDDENSLTLFLGYSTAALRLKGQLERQGIPVDREHPLLVCIPCGVGGAPGGITFGLREVFGDAVHCFFAEPAEAPCMTLGMASGLHSGVSVQDIGLSGLTQADGLAVGRPSGFVGRLMEPLLDGCFTLSDTHLLTLMRGLWDCEGIFVEPSAAAGFILAECKALPQLEHGTLVVWATGGSLVPEPVRRTLLGP